MSDVKIEPPEQLQAGQTYYRAHVRPLTEAESAGRQNIFIDIIGLDGTRQSTERFVIFSNSQEVANIAPDKPASEPYGADVPMYPGNSYGFRPWTFVGDNIWGLEHGRAIEVRWVAEQVTADGPPAPQPGAVAETPPATPEPAPQAPAIAAADLPARVEAALQDMQLLSAQVQTMQAQVDQALADLQQLQQELSGRQ